MSPGITDAVLGPQACLLLVRHPGKARSEPAAAFRLGFRRTAKLYFHLAAPCVRQTWSRHRPTGLLVSSVRPYESVLHAAMGLSILRKRKQASRQRPRSWIQAAHAGTSPVGAQSDRPVQLPRILQPNEPKNIARSVLRAPTTHSLQSLDWSCSGALHASELGVLPLQLYRRGLNPICSRPAKSRLPYL